MTLSDRLRAEAKRDAMPLWVRVELFRAADRIDALQIENTRLREALERITCEHISYEEHGGGKYATGVLDGHRCAVNIAKTALAGGPR